MLKPNVLIAVSGSISAYKACELCSRLVKAGHSVHVILSPSAQKFIGEASFEGITGNPVFTDNFKTGSMMSHIDLARWADFFIVYPASANTINKLAHGLSEDLLSTTYLALSESVKKFITPAMNTVMLNHPTVQRGLKQLQIDGCHILPTEVGRLACGEEGEGKLLSPEVTIETIFKSSSQIKPLKILITAGGTIEPIDGVRSITNFSTGRTGTELAHFLTHSGHNCTLLQSLTCTQKVSKNIKILKFSDFSSLDKLIQLELKSHYDMVIHAAAVSDYSVHNVRINNKIINVKESEKLSSDTETMQIELKRNPKIIASIKDKSINKNITLIGFKLTCNASEKLTNNKLKALTKNHIDYIVHNDLSKITQQQHPFTIYDSQLDIFAKGESKVELYEKIRQLCSEKNTSIQPEAQL